MKSLWALLGLALCTAFGFGAGSLAVLSRGLPLISGLEDFVPPSSTRIYAADGSLLAEFATQRRTPVALDEVPADLVRGLMAIEDHRFYDHIGVNPGRIAKAIVKDVLAGGFVEGASTITQQLTKVLFLTPEKTLARKLREALLALEIERRYTKDEILTFYLNQIYLGNGAYGVAAAAQVYFDKPLGELTLAEASLLAALPKAPALYNPFRHPQRARQRRDLVLTRLAALGWITPEAEAGARNTPLPATKPPRPAVRAPYFVETVRRQLTEQLGSDQVHQGGLRVYTTLNPNVQTASEAALERGLQAVDGRHPAGASSQGAVLVMDVANGAVRAHVGGRNWRESPFDRAWQARRQPGSSHKIFTYLTALEHGYSQAATQLDTPLSLRGGAPGRWWKPGNYDGTFRGRMTLRTALALSRNLPVVRLMRDLGKAEVDATARRLGLAGPFGEGLATALGVGGASLLELVRAYAAAPSGGMLSAPHWIRAVYGPDGRNLWPRPAAPRRVIEAGTAFVLADMLRAVVEEGTGRKARALPFPVAGKTGTTDDQRDAWFVGFSSQHAVGVWVGHDDNSPLGWGETGARAALPVWIDVMLASADGPPPPPWPVPPGVVFAEMDSATGRRAGPHCADTTHAAFARGTEPERSCDHGAAAWAQLTRRLRLSVGRDHLPLVGEGPLQ